VSTHRAALFCKQQLQSTIGSKRQNTTRHGVCSTYLLVLGPPNTKACHLVVTVKYGSVVKVLRASLGLATCASLLHGRSWAQEKPNMNDETIEWSRKPLASETSMHEMHLQKCYRISVALASLTRMVVGLLKSNYEQSLNQRCGAQVADGSGP
jgi:hypothetical protein